MKIAYIISTGMCVSPYNGIRVQAQTWADELERQGHEVTRVNPWDRQNWASYDAIHIFGYCGILNSLANLPTGRIVFSPIIDSFQPIWKYRLATHWGSSKLRLFSHNYEIRKAAQHISMWCVRSHFEYEYVHKAYGVSEDRISIIPLSYRIDAPEQYPAKEQFCLHVSKISDGRKNVRRLVDAAKKYNFRLVLAGSCDNHFEQSSLKKAIDSSTNIEYLGRVSDEQLINLYLSAKVFALPSICEGVGLVAVEAAACGCDIVVTEVGGPKEYYDEMAFRVSPYDTDAIGKAVIAAMSANNFQPKLMQHIKEKYHLSGCVRNLTSVYQNLLCV